MEAINRVYNGQRTHNFQRMPKYRSCAPRCFSIEYDNGTRTLDLMSDSQEECDAWYLGLQDLLSRCGAKGGSGAPQSPPAQRPMRPLVTAASPTSLRVRWRIPDGPGAHMLACHLQRRTLPRDVLIAGEWEDVWRELPPGNATPRDEVHAGGARAPSPPSDASADSGAEGDITSDDSAADGTAVAATAAPAPAPASAARQPVDTNPMWDVQVGGLSPDTAYVFRVRARTAAGWSPWSKQSRATSTPAETKAPKRRHSFMYVVGGRNAVGAGAKGLLGHGTERGARRDSLPHTLLRYGMRHLDGEDNDADGPARTTSAAGGDPRAAKPPLKGEPRRSASGRYLAAAPGGELGLVRGALERNESMESASSAHPEEEEESRESGENSRVPGTPQQPSPLRFPPHLDEAGPGRSVGGAVISTDSAAPAGTAHVPANNPPHASPAAYVAAAVSAGADSTTQSAVRTSFEVHGSVAVLDSPLSSIAATPLSVGDTQQMAPSHAAPRARGGHGSAGAPLPPPPPSTTESGNVVCEADEASPSPTALATMRQAATAAESRAGASVIRLSQYNASDPQVADGGAAGGTAAVAVSGAETGRVEAAHGGALRPIGEEGTVPRLAASPSTFSLSSAVRAAAGSPPLPAPLVFAGTAPGMFVLSWEEVAAAALQRRSAVSGHEGDQVWAWQVEYQSAELVEVSEGEAVDVSQLVNCRHKPHEGAHHRHAHGAGSQHGSHRSDSHRHHHHHHHHKHHHSRRRSHVKHHHGHSHSRHGSQHTRAQHLSSSHHQRQSTLGGHSLARDGLASTRAGTEVERGTPRAATTAKDCPHHPHHDNNHGHHRANNHAATNPGGGGDGAAGAESDAASVVDALLERVKAKFTQPGAPSVLSERNEAQPQQQREGEPEGEGQPPHEDPSERGGADDGGAVAGAGSGEAAASGGSAAGTAGGETGSHHRRGRSDAGSGLRRLAVSNLAHERGHDAWSPDDVGDGRGDGAAQEGEPRAAGDGDSSPSPEPQFVGRASSFEHGIRPSASFATVSTAAESAFQGADGDVDAEADAAHRATPASLWASGAGTASGVDAHTAAPSTVSTAVATAGADAASNAAGPTGPVIGSWGSTGSAGQGSNGDQSPSPSPTETTPEEEEASRIRARTGAATAVGTATANGSGSGSGSGSGVHGGRDGSALPPGRSPQDTAGSQDTTAQAAPSASPSTAAASSTRSSSGLAQGSRAVLGSRYLSCLVRAAAWEPLCQPLSGAHRHLTLSRLGVGRAYVFRVRCGFVPEGGGEGSVEWGSWSRHSALVPVLGDHAPRQQAVRSNRECRIIRTGQDTMVIAAPPDAPPDLVVAAAGPTMVRVRFESPTCNHLPVSTCEVQAAEEVQSADPDRQWYDTSTSPLQWRTVAEVKPLHGTVDVVACDLVPGGTYQLRARGRNALGSGRWCHPVTATTTEPAAASVPPPPPPATESRELVERANALEQYCHTLADALLAETQRRREVEAALHGQRA